MSLARRHTAAKKFQPKKIKLLLVAEAPPCDLDRYFYFEDVKQHDWLYRYVWEGLMGEKPAQSEKAQNLAMLRDRGVFLIDLHEGNISKPKASDLQPCVPGLIERIRPLKPKHIVLIKHSVYDAAFAALKAAGLPVIDAKLPFPTSGQQKKFLVGFRRALGRFGVAG